MVIDIILGTILVLVVIGVIVGYGIYPIRKDSYSELKDFLREKRNELREER